MKFISKTILLFIFYFSFGFIAKAQEYNLLKIIGTPFKIDNLEIAQNDFNEPLTITKAKKICENLGNEWRLPNRHELKFLFNKKNIFLNLKETEYLSSYVFFERVSTRSKNGKNSSQDSTFAGSVRLVRGFYNRPTNEDEFIEVIGSPIVLNDLEVAQNDFDEVLDWRTANNMLPINGGEWRLPTKEELMLIYNNKNNIKGFIDGDYWSSSEFVGEDIVKFKRYWAVNFSNGNQSGDRESRVNKNIRFVRSSSASKSPLIVERTSSYFNPQEHVYLDPQYARGVTSKRPGYINGYAKIGRLMQEKGEYGENVYSEGYIDNEGRIIISPNNYSLGVFSEGLVSVCNKLPNGSYKLGFMDITGKVVIPLVYQCDNDLKFSEGLCQVIGSNGKYGFIDKLGKVVIPFLYGDVGVEGFKNGIARVAKTDFIKDPMTINKLGKVSSNSLNNNDLAKKLINGTNNSKSNDRELSDVIAAEVLSSNILGNYIKGVLDGKYDKPNTKSNISSPSINSSNNSVCSMCKPYDAKGHYIKDFDPSSRTYKNWRYIKRPGYKPCNTCKATGTCLDACRRGKVDCPGWCGDNDICAICHGDRFELCSRCKGSGKGN